MDCGAFVNHYAGDITRVFPMSGKFSGVQERVYNALLRRQIELIEMVKPDVRMRDMWAALDRVIVELVIELGLLHLGPNGQSPPLAVAEEKPSGGSGGSEKRPDHPEAANWPAGLPPSVASRISKLFCPHGLSHHLGCNVHDPVHWTGGYRQHFGRLLPGAVITIEPGIYFHEGRLGRERESPLLAELIDWELAAEYAREVGGIRIEDDVLVTEAGYDVRSAACPKTVSEIEAVMAGG
jgi:Xaa-Pro aminopeptidase